MAEFVTSGGFVNWAFVVIVATTFAYICRRYKRRSALVLWVTALVCFIAVIAITMVLGKDVHSVLLLDSESGLDRGATVSYGAFIASIILYLLSFNEKKE